MRVLLTIFVLQGLFRIASIGRTNIEGSSLEALLNEQVKRTSLERARTEALQSELPKANLEKITAQSEVMALQGELAETSIREKRTELHFGAK